MKSSVVVTIFLSLLLATVFFSPAQAMTGQEVYQKTCNVCHGTGVAGAPKLGDKAAWAPRIADGMNEMYENALHGDGAMPPKGGNSALSDDEVKAAVDFIVENSK